jgi:thymidylate synthase (FAD)
MNLIDSSVEVWNQGNTLTDIYKHIERCGRVCYKSEDKITSDSYKSFIERIKKSGHGSVLEHGTVYLKTYSDDVAKRYSSNKYSICNSIDNKHFITTNMRVIIENGWEKDLIFRSEPDKVYHEPRITVHFVLSRAIANEFVRHRVFSFSQESQRYCNYSLDKFDKQILFITPSWMDKSKLEMFKNDISLITEYAWDFNESEKETSNIALFLNQLAEAEGDYFRMIEKGWKPQQAREILPNACKTELIMTGFLKDWFGFFKLRCAESAHPDARKLANELFSKLFGSFEKDFKAWSNLSKIHYNSALFCNVPLKNMYDDEKI